MTREENQVLSLFSAPTEESSSRKNSGGRSNILSGLFVVSETDKDICSGRNQSKQIACIEKEWQQAQKQDKRLAEEWMTKKAANDLRKKGRRHRNLSEALLVEPVGPGNQTGVFACLLHAVTHTSAKLHVVTPATWEALVRRRSALRLAC